MIDFARISQMIAYAQQGAWPIPDPHQPAPEVTGWRRWLWPLGVLRRPRQWLCEPPAFRRLSTAQQRILLALASKRYWEYPWSLDRLADLAPGAAVLDCGCGKARFAAELARRGFQTYGLDYFTDNPSHWGIDPQLRRQYQGQITFLNGGMEKIPWESDFFDAITCISVMEHVVLDTPDAVNQPQFHLQCLDEMKRVLKPGGRLICTYDLFANERLMHAGSSGWGLHGWNHLDDIAHLDMELLDPHAPRFYPSDLVHEDDVYWVAPRHYFQEGFAESFASSYARLTAVGFCLIKR